MRHFTNEIHVLITVLRTKHVPFVSYNVKCFLFKGPLITSFTSLVMRQINSDDAVFSLGFEIFGRLINWP